MTYGQQPMNGSPYGQQPYGQQPMNYADTINVQASQSYERAEHVSVTRAYGEMCPACSSPPPWRSSRR